MSQPRTQLPPFNCATWCDADDRHINESVRADQACFGPTGWIDCSLSEVAEDGEAPSIGVYPARRWRRADHVTMDFAIVRDERIASFDVDLTIDEARALSRTLDAACDLVGAA